MKKLVEWIKKHKVLFVLLVVVVGSVSFVAGIKVADMPAFCGVSCHEMQYYVDSLKASYHGNSKKGEVTCMDCHSEQGFVNHSIEHIKASLLMGMHFTEDYKKDYLNKHTKFLGDFKQDKCQACHPGRSDMAYFMEVPHHKYEMVNANCIRCHKEIVDGKNQTSKAAAFSINPAHEHHANNGVLCIKCHKLVVHGTDPQAGNRPNMHTCFSNCHDDKTAPRNDCGKCHTLAQKILSGNAGGSVEATAGVMSEGVKCVDCHVEVSGTSKHHPVSLKPDPQTCVNCHDDTYKGMVSEWQADYAKRLQDVESAYNALEINKLSAGQREELGEVLANTEYNLQIIRMDGSRGAHNLDYINTVADKITDDLKQIKHLMGQI